MLCHFMTMDKSHWWNSWFAFHFRHVNTTNQSNRVCKRIVSEFIHDNMIMCFVWRWMYRYFILRFSWTTSTCDIYTLYLHTMLIDLPFYLINGLVGERGNFVLCFAIRYIGKFDIFQWKILKIAYELCTIERFTMSKLQNHAVYIFREKLKFVGPICVPTDYTVSLIFFAWWRPCGLKFAKRVSLLFYYIFYFPMEEPFQPYSDIFIQVEDQRCCSLWDRFSLNLLVTFCMNSMFKHNRLHLAKITPWANFSEWSQYIQISIIYF